MGSPFECGFSPFSINRPPFSLHFFILALVFIVFDLELTLIFPYFRHINEILESSDVFLILDSLKVSSVLIFILILIKLYAIRNHFLSFLLSLEVIILLLVFTSGIISVGGISVTWFLSLFLVIVCGASVGMSILVNLIRIHSKEIELFSLNF